MFSEKEIAYLKSQPLARIGTSSKSGRPDVAAVSFDTDGEYVYVSGRDVMNTMKYKNVLENPRASFVVDDLKTMKPWAPRGIKIQGKADIVKHTGYMGPGTYIRIKPVLKRSWNI
ncbi:PPOX class F420-dependent oxidoreductase [Candidatus Bathyarchaeota archaeon]|nr:MAG: PPOX class F420-dependent oxidoreductase [Candidatus Bathyarchaeota archaeon]TMI21518.1 MAG: PPOX class F420-dependent oxidoreductase [Candidatus Bathyarchaeota archaeon]